MWTADRLPRWARDPLLLFALIGVAVFAVDRWRQGDGDATVVVTQAEVDRLAALWHTQMGQAPSAAELDNLVADHVREEILVREARRLGLGEGDAIIRRRLAQKLSFLTEDVAVLEPPSEDALRDFYAANPERYATPATTTFSHVYFAAERRDDPWADAERALAGFDAEAWRDAGDPFMLGRTYAHSGASRIRRDFGAAFADALEEVPPDGAWRGPVRSAYGVHLVRVDARIPAAGAEYEQVARRVAADFDAQRRAEANRAYFEELRARYAVVLP